MLMTASVPRVYSHSYTHILKGTSVLDKLKAGTCGRGRFLVQWSGRKFNPPVLCIIMYDGCLYSFGTEP